MRNAPAHGRIICAHGRIGDVEGERLYIKAGEQLQSMRVHTALRLFERAEQAHYDPDSCAAGRWDCRMLLGDFEAAWRESDLIARRGNPDPHRFWDGQPFADRRVLIRCLHGLGDTIQFIRYAPLIGEQAKTLTVEAQPALKALLEQARIADQIITWGEPEPDWDQQIEIVELPRVFRTTVKSVPSRIPYLTVCDDGVDVKRGPKLRVGLVWGCSSFNPERSIRLKELGNLLTIPGVSFFSLQAGPQRAELEPWSSQVHDLYNGSFCVLPAARNLMTLDLVISVDTMMAHLAGAMGRPVWTLLPYRCDWRWMMKRVDSPWYPTMRLFRQNRSGEWRSVIRQVEQALRTLIREANFESHHWRQCLPARRVSAAEAQEV
ncbi:MAG: ADP-heptose--LPS heptosyltransferase [Bryobacteraceae bacterium]